YWQPAGLMAKYDFYKIEQDPFNKECWDTIVSGEGQLCSSDFLVARLGVAVSSPFAQANPQLIEFFDKLRIEPAVLNQMILTMTETRAPAADIAEQFLRNHPDVWRAWLPPEAAQKASTALGVAPDQSTAAQPGALPDSATEPAASPVPQARDGI